MKQQFVNDALHRFAKVVITQSRANLTRQRKNVDKKLYDSLAYDLEVGSNSFSLSLLMEDYGDFQDKGVRGADPSKVSKNAKIRGQQAPNSPYRFGSGNYSGKWGEFTKSLENWAKKRNFRLRDKQGRFTKGNYKTIAQILARNIYARGIAPSLFFTKPFEKHFEKLPQEVIEAFALDIEQFLKFTRDGEL
jgi:hypothetical protein